MDEFKLPRLIDVGFLVLIVTAPLAGIHQAVAQAPGSTPVRTVDPVDPVQTAKNTPFFGDATVDVVVMTVPDKKRLVIEYVSAVALLPTGQDLVFANITTTTGGQRISHEIPTSPRKAFNGTLDITVFGQPLRIYADKNTDVTFSMTRNPATGLSQLAGVDISGYFVPQP